MDNEASSAGIIKRRRRYSREFKERIFAECLQPGESIAAVAVRHELNPNMVHKLRKSLQRPAQEESIRLPAPGTDAPGPASVFANKRANRVKVLVCDGFGIWLAARRLHQGRFVWTALRSGDAVAIDARQLQALVVGLPWQYAAANHVIDRH